MDTPATETVAAPASEPEPDPGVELVAPPEPEEEAAPATVAAPRTRPAARTRPRLTLTQPPEPDAPITPLPPGAFVDYLRSTGQMQEPEPTSEPDHRADALRLLRGIAGSSTSSDSDRITATREIAKLTGAYEVAERERVQRSVAEVDAEIAQELRALGWTVQPPG